jgi:hypothetical protein
MPDALYPAQSSTQREASAWCTMISLCDRHHYSPSTSSAGPAARPGDVSRLAPTRQKETGDARDQAQTEIPTCLIFPMPSMAQ